MPYPHINDFLKDLCIDVSITSLLQLMNCSSKILIPIGLRWTSGANFCVLIRRYIVASTAFLDFLPYVLKLKQITLALMIRFPHILSLEMNVRISQM